MEDVCICNHGVPTPGSWRQNLHARFSAVAVCRPQKGQRFCELGLEGAEGQGGVWVMKQLPRVPGVQGLMPPYSTQDSHLSLAMNQGPFL